MNWTDFYYILAGPAGPIVGAALATVAFFLWKDWRREMRLQDRIEALEQEQKDVLLPLVEKCAGVIADNTATMKRLEKALDRCILCKGKNDRDTLERLLQDAEEARKEGT